MDALMVSFSSLSFSSSFNSSVPSELVSFVDVSFSFLRGSTGDLDDLDDFEEDLLSFPDFLPLTRVSRRPRGM